MGIGVGKVYVFLAGCLECIIMYEYGAFGRQKKRVVKMGSRWKGTAIMIYEGGSDRIISFTAL